MSEENQMDMFKEFGITTEDDTTSQTQDTTQTQDTQTQDTQTQTADQNQQTQQTDQTQDQTQDVDEATTLREQLNRMAGVLASHGITLADVETQTQTQTTDTTQQTQTQTQTQTQQQQTQVPQWGPTVEITDEEFADAVENKATFQKILTTVRDQAVERTVQSIPQLVVNMVKQQLYLAELSREFYQANEDLAGVRPFVGVVANEIASKNPGWTPEQVMTETATAVRQRLALKGKAQTQTQQQTQTPGLPNPTNRGRAAAPQLSKLEKELQELMNV